MAIAHSRLTAQGQISVPSAVRKKLGLRAGSTLEWYEEEDGTIVVRRVGRYSSADLHQAVFPRPPRPRTLAELKQGPGLSARRRHARR